MCRDPGRNSPPRLFLFLVAIVSFVPEATAGTISLEWDPVSAPDLEGYRVYYGTSSGSYTQMVQVPTTQATLSGLQDCVTYYVAIKAVTVDGTESVGFSNEITGWARPDLVSANPANVEQGSTVAVAIDGANFQSGAGVQTSSPDVAVNSVTRNDCNQLVADLSIGSGAALGPLDVEVVNPDGVFGAGAGLLNVGADASAPTITGLQPTSVGSTVATIVWSTDEPSDSQVFYRRVGESDYQQTAVDASLVTAHSVSLTGLDPDTGYEFSVRGADAAGNVANLDGAEPFTTLPNTFTYIRFEAEAGPIGAPAEINSGPDAFSAAWVNLAPGASGGNPNSPSGTWDYGFHLPASGTWHVWFRMYGVANNRNGWLEQVDGGGFDYIEPSQNGEWEWVPGRSYVLGGGLHTLTLGGNEAEARIDRMLITDDPAFLPSEQPVGDLIAPAPAAALAAVSGDGLNQLSWTNSADGDVANVIVRYRTDGHAPISPADGMPLLDRPAFPDLPETLDHTGLINETTYSYSVFILDGAGNASSPASIEATPEPAVLPPPTVQNVHRTDTK